MAELDRFAAWAGAAVSVLSLSWQVLTWRRSRHKIQVLVTNQFRKSQDGLVDHFVVTKAINTGKDPIAVIGFGIKAGKSGSLMNFSLQHPSASFPSWLGQNESAEFSVLAEELRAVVELEDLRYRDLRTWVALSDGTSRNANKPVPLA